MKTKHRILIVDDNEAIHSDFKKILIDTNYNEELEEIEGTLFGTKKSTKSLSYQYVIDDAYQGEEAVEKVDKAAEEGFPYAVIYMDVRMPPGMDGVQATEKIWEKHPNVEMVIASAYSDYSWDKILEKFGQTDKLLFVKKPFNIIVIKQLTLSLITKWDIARKNREYMEHLETQVKERTVELQELLKHMTMLKEKAEESDRLKSAFLANMSHEIRSPMNTIIGFTELLARNKLPEDKRKKYLSFINTSGKSLLNLINDIICIAKIEAGVIDLQVESFPLNSLLDELKELFQAELDGNGITGVDIVFDNSTNKTENLIIHTDRERLKQIITNLFSNAMKFTKYGTIGIGFKVEVNNTIRFYVKDTGIGIKENDLEMIFGRFKQARDSSSEISNGTGLGLAISKNLVEMLGGTIGVVSEFGKGSEFYFTLPFEPGVLEHDSSVNGSNIINTISTQKKYTVLVAEDQAFNYYLIEELLSDDNLILLWAKDGQESIDIFSRHPEIDLVLMDIKMPVLDGIQAMLKIKSLNRHVPVIAQTAFAMEDEQKGFKDQGFDDYITKPFDGTSFHKKINTWLNRAESS